MFIEYLGHSCFYIKSEDFSVVTDPFSGIGYPLKKVYCDYALSSHGHFDHNNFGGVNAGLNVTESTEKFTAIACFHDDAHGAKRGKNNAFYFKADGLSVLHLGDLGERFSISSARKFNLPVDVLLIPVGGNYTIDATEALKYINFIGAKVNVPMHYKTKNSNIDIDGLDKFLDAAGEYKAVRNGINITAENINGFSKITVIDFDKDF